MENEAPYYHETESPKNSRPASASITEEALLRIADHGGYDRYALSLAEREWAPLSPFWYIGGGILRLVKIVLISSSRVPGAKEDDGSEE